MNRARYLIVGLLSMTLIGLELTWTRIFSAEFFYTFAFLVLSLAVLGLGLGALALRLFPKLSSENNLPHLLSLTAFFTIIGPAVVFMLNLDFSSLFYSWIMVGKLIMTIFLLNAAYFCGGMALASIFRRYNQEMPGLVYGGPAGCSSRGAGYNSTNEPDSNPAHRIPDRYTGSPAGINNFTAVAEGDPPGSGCVDDISQWTI